MIDYLTDRLYFEAKKEVVQESVESYKEELLKVMQRMERLELQRKVDGLKKKYSMYLYGLGMYITREDTNKEKRNGQWGDTVRTI